MNIDFSQPIDTDPGQLDDKVSKCWRLSGLVEVAGHSQTSLCSAAPGHPWPLESNAAQLPSFAPYANTKKPPQGRFFDIWWRRRELNPRPQVLRLWLYMLIRSIDLIDGYPTGRENQQRAWISFNESTPGVLHRDPIWGDSRDPVVWARSRAEGSTQVFKLLKRSCRRWQLKVCNQFYELFAARHAPRVL